MPKIDPEYYDEAQVTEAWKDEFGAVCDEYGIGFVAELLGVAEATVRSWKSHAGKMPSAARMVHIFLAFSQIKVNTPIENLLLASFFRIVEVDDFRIQGDACLKEEAFDLLRLVGRIMDAGAREDPDAGLRLMDVYDTLGKRMRGDFEAMKAAERTP